MNFIQSPVVNDARDLVKPQLPVKLRLVEECGREGIRGGGESSVKGV